MKKDKNNTRCSCEQLGSMIDTCYLCKSKVVETSKNAIKGLKCEQCGKADNTVKEYDEDPYQAEINDIHESCVLCDECYHESVMDI